MSYFNTSASGVSAGGASASECEAERGRVYIRRLRSVEAYRIARLRASLILHKAQKYSPGICAFLH